MKSTTLDVKLKETERELKQHEREIADQMEVTCVIVFYITNISIPLMNSYTGLARKNSTQQSPY